MNCKRKDDVEITAPAGSFDCLNAAIKAGANSIYFGVGNLNMRARATVNFEPSDLSEIVQICEKNDVKPYLAVNTIIYDEDMDEVKSLCRLAKDTGISAVIAGDIAVMQYARSIELETHASVQANIGNTDAVKFYSQYADTIILARELKLNQIKNIVNTIKKQNITGPSGRRLKIELFAHGALCVAVSGLCHMSLAVYDSPANKGACFQNCRRAYKVTDAESGDELVIDNKYVMSPKDLCTVSVLDDILDAGVSVLKLEGRGRSADYVYTVTKVYREAVDAWKKGAFDKAMVPEWMDRLKSVFNRGFWEGGYYLGEKMGAWCGSGGNMSLKKKVHIGKVLNYYSKKSVAEISLDAGNIHSGDEILITGAATGSSIFNVADIMLDEKLVAKAAKGSAPTIKVPEKVRANDKIYLLQNRKFGE